MNVLLLKDESASQSAGVRSSPSPTLKVPMKEETDEEEASITPPTKTFQSRRRGAVSAEVYTDDDVKNYVKKVSVEEVWSILLNRLEPVSKLRFFQTLRSHF